MCRETYKETDNQFNLFCQAKKFLLINCSLKTASFQCTFHVKQKYEICTGKGKAMQVVVLVYLDIYF